MLTDNEPCFRSHQGEHLLRGLRSTLPLFALLSLSAYAIFVVGVFMDHLAAPAAAALCGCTLAVSAMAMPLIAPRWFEARQARTVNCVTVATAIVILSVPVATALLCYKCGASTRHCSDGEADAQFVAAQVALISLSALPVVLFRLPVLHAALPALAAALIQTGVLSACDHGLRGAFVAALAWGHILLVGLLTGAAAKLESLELGQFQVLCGASVVDAHDYTFEMIRTLRQGVSSPVVSSMRERVSVRFDQYSQGTEQPPLELKSHVANAAAEIRALLEHNQRKRASRAVVQELEKTLVLLENHKAVGFGTINEQLDQVEDQETKNWLQSALSVDFQTAASASRMRWRGAIHSIRSSLRSSISEQGGCLPNIKRQALFNEDTPDPSEPILDGIPNPSGMGSGMGSGLGVKSSEADSLDSSANRAVVQEAEAVARSITVGCRSLAEDMMSEWSTKIGYDVMRIHQESGGHALLLMGEMVLHRHGVLEAFSISSSTVCGLLASLEANYGTNPYHNSVHAADVLVSMHLFLQKFRITERMTKLHVIPHPLPCLAAASLHTFLVWRPHASTPSMFDSCSLRLWALSSTITTIPAPPTRTR